MIVLKEKLKEYDSVVPAEDKLRVLYLGKLLEERAEELYSFCVYW